MSFEDAVEVDDKLEEELRPLAYFAGKKTDEGIQEELLCKPTGVFCLCIIINKLLLYRVENIDNKKKRVVIPDAIIKHRDDGQFYIASWPDRRFHSVQKLIVYYQYNPWRDIVRDEVVSKGYLRRSYVQSEPSVNYMNHDSGLCLVYANSLATSSTHPVKGDFGRVTKIVDKRCSVYVFALKKRFEIQSDRLETIDIQDFYGGHVSAKEGRVILAQAKTGHCIVRRGFRDGQYAFYVDIKVGQTVMTVEAIHNMEGGHVQLTIVTPIRGATAKTLTFRTLDDYVKYVKFHLRIYIDQNCLHSFPLGLTIFPKDEKALRKTYLNKTCCIICNVQDLENGLQLKEGDTVVVREISAEGFVVESLSESSPALKHGTVAFHYVRPIDTEDWYHGEKTEEEATAALRGHEKGTFLVTETDSDRSRDATMDGTACAVTCNILYVAGDGEVKKFFICKEKWKFFLLTLTNLETGEAGREFRSLHELIQCAQTNVGIPTSKSQVLVLGNPLPRSHVETPIEEGVEIEFIQAAHAICGKCTKQKREEGERKEKTKDGPKIETKNEAKIETKDDAKKATKDEEADKKGKDEKGNADEARDEDRDIDKNKGEDKGEDEDEDKPASWCIIL